MTTEILRNCCRIKESVDHNSMDAFTNLFILFSYNSTVCERECVWVGVGVCVCVCVCARHTFQLEMALEQTAFLWQPS